MNDGSSPRGRGVQSVEVSVEVLTALARNRGPMALSELAAQIGMPAAKVHRYMASFVDTGMVRHRRSGAYDLGPLAAEIGIAAVARVDPVNHAADALPDLVEATGLTALLAVWGTQGPTVVRWEKAATPLITMLGIGSVLPITRSATGRAFMAHMPDRLLECPVAEEAPERTLADFDEQRRNVRSTHLATADQDFIPGLFAIASPIRDLHGCPAAVATLISTDSGLLDERHPARDALVTFTRLGF